MRLWKIERAIIGFQKSISVFYWEGRITFERKSYRDRVWVDWKNHTNERIFQVMTRLWPGNENSYKWANVPGNNQIMTQSIHHIVILPHIILLYVAPFRLTSVLSCCLSTFRSSTSWLWDFTGIIVPIALSVLSLALQDLLVHRQEISLDFNTLSIRKT